MHTAFKAALAEADYQRREYIRVKEGKKHKTSSTFKACMSLTRLILRPAHHYVAWETTNLISEKKQTHFTSTGSWNLKTKNGLLSNGSLPDKISPKLEIASVGAQWYLAFRIFKAIHHAQGSS